MIFFRNNQIFSIKLFIRFVQYSRQLIRNVKINKYVEYHNIQIGLNESTAEYFIDK